MAWQLALVALAGVPLLLGAQWLSTVITKKADTVADEANAELNTGHRIRPHSGRCGYRGAEPERSLVGDALDRQHGAMTKLLLFPDRPGDLPVSQTRWRCSRSPLPPWR